MRRHKVVTRHFSGAFMEERRFWRKSSAKRYVEMVEGTLHPWVICELVD